MITTTLEFWNNQWWRWYLKDGKPYKFEQVCLPELESESKDAVYKHKILCATCK